MCRNGVSDSHKLQTWLYELADLEFTAVYAESQHERRECHDSAEMLTAHWETLQSNVTSWYGALTGCQYCHSRLVPLSGVSADCASTIESVCEKYGSLTGVIASRASPALKVCLRTYSSNGTSAWYDSQMCH